MEHEYREVGHRRRPLALALVLVAASVVGCDGPAPSPTPTPTRRASGPTVAYSTEHTHTFSGTVWTFYATVNPNGSPTTVALELLADPGDPTSVERTLPVAEGVTTPGAVSVDAELPESGESCVRFTATNAEGTASTTPYCVTPRST